MVAGCVGSVEPAPRAPGDQAIADSIVALIGRIDAQQMQQSFEQLGDLRFRRLERTEQFDGDGNRLAFEERVVQRTESGVRILDADSSGTSDFGYVHAFTSNSEDHAAPVDLPSYVIPDDPAYASVRNMEAYDYERTSDTTIYDRNVRIVRIRARPGVGDGQSIRRARLYLDGDADRLVGIYVKRHSAALWYREESELFMRIDQLPSGRWVPRETRFETLIKLPFRPMQQFRTSTSYSAFEPGS